MIYFTADLHFYHKNIITSTNRPFLNVDEMNRVLIQNWNNKVSFDDDVYILGDFTMHMTPVGADEVITFSNKTRMGNQSCVT